MGNRRQSREAALGYLYQWDSRVGSVVDTPEKFAFHFGVDENFRSFFYTIVHGVLDQHEKIDSAIEAVAEHWKLYRMARVDRSILRMGCFELLNEPETSHRIIIDEAVELAKIYGSTDSGAFVNGILDKLARTLRPNEKVLGDAERSS